MIYFKHTTRVVGDSEFIIFYKDSDTIAKIYCPDNDAIYYFPEDGTIWVENKILQCTDMQKKQYRKNNPDFNELCLMLGFIL